MEILKSGSLLNLAVSALSSVGLPFSCGSCAVSLSGCLKLFSSVLETAMVVYGQLQDIQCPNLVGNVVATRFLFVSERPKLSRPMMKSPAHQNLSGPILPWEVI